MRKLLCLVLLLSTACTSDARPRPKPKPVPTPTVSTAKPIPNLTQDELNAFNVGKQMFAYEWNEQEGRGPYFTARKCSDCHNTEGNISQRNCYVIDVPDKSYGGPVLQTYSIFIPADFSKPVPENSEIPVKISEELYPFGYWVSVRRSKSVLGFGLVSAIPDAEIIKNTTNGGKYSWVKDLKTGEFKVGKLGMKCQHANPYSFTAEALLREIGITNPHFPDEEGLFNDPASLVNNPNKNINTTNEVVNTISKFVEYSNAPSQTTTWSTQVMNGWMSFQKIGCAVCHVRSFTTDSDNPALDNITIYPYSDFLLHDMGSGADHVEQVSDKDGNKIPKDWMRTAPLWGLRFNNTLWHDGNIAAGDYTSCINKHDGQGKASKDAYNKLSSTEKSNIIAFLNAL